MDTFLVVFFAGIMAGAMNALAGGGSFVSLPALIAAGVPPVLANTSSTVALFPGGLASAWAYRDGLRPVGSVSLRALVAATLCGGFTGALLLLRTSSAAFTFVLPWLLLVASIALAFGRRIGNALRARWQIHAHAVLVVQFALGVYGGYFGGAVGIMMIAMWGLLENCDVKQLNAPRTLLVSTANVAAVLAFIVANAVRWPETLLMLMGAIAGSYFGARVGR
ncbi:sulfite exporter TauE/SafE family protein, partial [Paraburkholderia sp.]|uniref:sulfite exporter TauE/SafE family protein n=1 Tax=Paraburkholderia sp. TaxID=1926495 RepID=UPI002F4077E3